jgi:hypothetical protein
MFRHRVREQEEEPLMKLIFTAVAALTLSVVLSGCIVTPTPYGAVVTEAPPALQVEAIGVVPSPGYFWIGGSYGWVGGRYVWERGHWQSPRPGYRWTPHVWRRAGSGWREEGGRWERMR